MGKTEGSGVKTNVLATEEKKLSFLPSPPRFFLLFLYPQYLLLCYFVHAALAYTEIDLCQLEEVCGKETTGVV